MNYNFDELIDRSGFLSSKCTDTQMWLDWHLVDHVEPDMVPFTTADMDFRCAKPIQDALRELVEHNIYGYAFPSDRYYQSIINWFRDTRGWEIRREEIFWQNGTLEAVKHAMEAFSEPGDGILINVPGYYPFLDVIEAGKRRVVTSPLLNDGNGYYTIDYEDLERKIERERVKLFLFCNPNNPTGRIFTDEEIRRVAEICRRHRTIIVADEIHGELIRREAVFHPMATVVGPEGILSCTALNKTFNLAGLQAANVIVQDPALRERYAKAVTGVLTINIFTAVATQAAYESGAEWLDQVRDYLDGTIDWAMRFLRERMPTVKCFRPEGTYFLWMDFRGYGLSEAELLERICDRAKAILEPGSWFDPEYGLGFMRMALPAPRSVVQSAFERIAGQFPEATN